MAVTIERPLAEETKSDSAFGESARVSRAGQPMRWTSEQYHHMDEAGLFQDLRVELLEGEIIEMAAMNAPHWTATHLTTEALRRVFHNGFIVVEQLPIKLTDGSEPEPDVAVVRGETRDFTAGIPQPQVIVLLVEISVSTLAYDRGRKLSAYAKAGITEYWLLDVEARQLEIYRSPVEMVEQPYGFGYETKRVLSEIESVSPLAAPDASVAVADLLP